MVRRRIIIVTIGVVAFSAVTLLAIASNGGFDLSKRAINDPVEGSETEIVENPAPPNHPGFPVPAASIDSNATSNSTGD